MVYDPNSQSGGDDRHFQRLTECVEWSRRRGDKYREINQLLVDASMGEYYPRFSGIKPETPLNLLWMTHRAMSRFLYMRTPRVTANTEVTEWKTLAEDAEIALNKTIKKADFGSTVSAVVDQGLYSVGALFMSADYVGTPGGMRQKLVLEDISFPDLIWDVGVQDLRKSDYLGREIDMKYVDLVEHPLFDKEATREVQPTRHDHTDQQQSTTWQRSYGSYKTDLYDYVRVCQVFDRPSNRMYMWPKYQPSVKLMDQPWTGPEHGPIRILHFGTPVGHPFPVSPMMNVYRLARAMNVLTAKALQQQQAAKGLLLYTSASKDEAQGVVDSVDQNSVLQEHGAMRYTHIGGAAPDTVAMAELARKLFSYGVGNLDQLLGLGSQAPTLGQERMLSEATTANMQDMGEIVYEFVQAACEDAYWYNIRDPETRTGIRKKMGQTGLSYEVAWTPEKRAMVERMRFDVEVEPYSYRARTPDGRLADFLGAIQLLMPFAPMMAAQGITLDLEGVVRTIAKYKDLPELYDALILNQDPERLAQLFGPREGQTPMEANDTGPKRYIRESRSDGSGEAQELLRSFGRNQEQRVEAA